MTNDEQIGFHKGSLATLAKEREELVKIVRITEQLMEAHVKALKELGVDLEAEAKKAQKTDDTRLDEKVA
jgi:thiaminase